MKFLMSVVFLSIIISPLSAAGSYMSVLITKTAKKSNLKRIKNRLDSLHVKMYVKQTPSMYYVYSKKFTNQRALQYEYKKIKRYFPSAKITQIVAKPVSQKRPPQERLQEREAPLNIFVNLAYGTNNLSGVEDTNTSTGTSNSGSSFNVEGGYIFDKKFSLLVGYSSASTDDISVANAYGSLNYNTNIIKNLDIFAGLTFGYSTLELTNFDESQASSCLLYGGQVGFTYKLLENIFINLAYQGLGMNHSIVVDDTDATIDFTFMHNLQLGLQLRF